MIQIKPGQKSRWEQRIARAGILEKTYSSAREMLHFYQQVAGFQASLHGFLKSCGYRPGSGCQHPCPDKLDFTVVLPKFQHWLHFLETAAPVAMAQAAHQLMALPWNEWEQLLSRCWRDDKVVSGKPAVCSLIAFAFLQPVAEYLAEEYSADPKIYSGATCPFCGRSPAVGALRPEGDGGKRSLICCFCAFEWQYRRIVCAACGEEDVYKLPVYTSEEFPQVRVEACDTCRLFIKTVDLTNYGNADPLVDELASIPVTLWARQAGYTKLQCNLMGE